MAVMANIRRDTLKVGIRTLHIQAEKRADVLHFTLLIDISKRNLEQYM